MLGLFIARKLYRNKDGGKNVSKPAVLIALMGVAIGMAVMIVSVAIVIGFKQEVRNKVIGFGSHIQITNFDSASSYETTPILASDSLLNALKKYRQINHIQRFSTKPAIVKTEDNFEGVVIKGVGPEFDKSFIQKYLLEGSVPVFSDITNNNQVLISKTLADKLHLKLGDRIFTYFFQDKIRVRRLTIKGIYQTNFAEYDNMFILSDIAMVNKLNNWKKGQVSGLELTVKDYNRLEETTADIAQQTTNKKDKYGGIYYVRHIREIQPQIFAWLNLLNLNVWVILCLMLGISGFTVISGLLIIILERTQMIGLLKALGAPNHTVRKIFLWLSAFIVGRGMLWGNIIGLSICALQYYFKIIKLDAATYYIDTVPVSVSLWWWILLNAGTMFISMMMLVGPSYLIAKIRPADSMRYE